MFTVEVSPMTQALIGVWYGKRYHVPTYLYVQDLWPENVETVTNIHNRVIIAPINKMVDKIYRETNQIFTTSPSFVEAIVNRPVPVDRNKVHYWPQYAEEFYRPLPTQVVEGIDKNDKSFKIALTGKFARKYRHGARAGYPSKSSSIVKGCKCQVYHRRRWTVSDGV